MQSETQTALSGFEFFIPITDDLRIVKKRGHSSIRIELHQLIEGLDGWHRDWYPKVPPDKRSDVILALCEYIIQRHVEEALP